MKHLTAQDVLVLHALAIDETGGMHGIRDIGLLHSAVERSEAVFDGRKRYAGAHLKAAVLFESLLKNHVFLDGNKRVAVIAAARFLSLHGYELTASQKEVEAYTLRVIDKKLNAQRIADWFKRYTRKMKI